MDDCISRKDTIAKIREEGIYGSGYSDSEREENVIDMIECVPAADVRPVVHGKWIMNDDSKTVCSLCGNVVAFVSHPDKRWDFAYFCPNCGADMREES